MYWYYNINKYIIFLCRESFIYKCQNAVVNPSACICKFWGCPNSYTVYMECCNNFRVWSINECRTADNVQWKDFKMVKWIKQWNSSKHDENWTWLQMLFFQPQRGMKTPTNENLCLLRRQIEKAEKLWIQQNRTPH